MPLKIPNAKEANKTAINKLTLASPINKQKSLIKLSSAKYGVAIALMPINKIGNKTVKILRGVEGKSSGGNVGATNDKLGGLV